MKIPLRLLVPLLLFIQSIAPLKSLSQVGATAIGEPSPVGSRPPMPVPASSGNAQGKKVFGYLTFDDTKWTSSSWGDIPVDSLPWEVLTHAVLFAAGGGTPIPNSYKNQLVHLAQKAHQHGVYAGLCYGGSGDEALIGMINSTAAWPGWIDYNLSLIDDYGIDFIEFDLENSVSGSSVRAFFDVFYDSLQVRRSANNPDAAPFIVLTVGPSRAASWSNLEPFVGHVNLMSYDYIGDWWGRIIFDCAAKSYQNWNGTGANLDYYSAIGSTNAPAPSLQQAAIRVRNAGWPSEKIVIGFDANPTYWYGGTFPDGRGPRYIRQPTSGNTSTAGSSPDFSSQWGTISQIPSSQIYFDQIAQAYWAHTGSSLADDKLWVFATLPGRDSGMAATRRIIDSMDLGGVMFWNLGSEIWNTSSVPPGGRGWFFSQIRKHFSGFPASQPLPPAPARKVKGEAFFDANQDGQRGATDRNVAGWRITLTGPAGMQQLTDSAGAAVFSSLEPGVYTLSMEQKPGWAQTTPAANHTVTVDSTTDSISVSFGLYSSSAFAFPVSRNWNIVSVPVASGDMTAGFVFPLSVTPAFSFHEAYIQEPLLRNGEGYWMKFDEGHDVWLTGPPKQVDTVNLGLGWNFIGSLSVPIPLSNLRTIPAGILSPYVYGYGPGTYLTSTIEPGTGYWVSASAPGRVILDATPLAADPDGGPAAAATSFGTITFASADGSVRTLYLGTSGTPGTPVTTVPAPPGPPSGGFRVGYGGDAIVALASADPADGGSLPISIEGASYPVRVSWNFEAADPEATLLGPGIRQPLTGTGLLDIPSAGGVFSLRLGEGIASIPQEFRLEQNYPNPFNSTTVIGFSLPADSRVALELYNMLGERVATIADLVLPAGAHSVPFDAGDLATGVYLYRITAFRDGSGVPFVDSRKLLLVR